MISTKIDIKYQFDFIKQEVKKKTIQTIMDERNIFLGCYEILKLCLQITEEIIPSFYVSINLNKKLELRNSNNIYGFTIEGKTIDNCKRLMAWFEIKLKDNLKEKFFTQNIIIVSRIKETFFNLKTFLNYFEILSEIDSLRKYEIALLEYGKVLLEIAKEKKRLNLIILLKWWSNNKKEIECLEILEKNVNLIKESVKYTISNFALVKSNLYHKYKKHYDLNIEYNKCRKDYTKLIHNSQQYIKKNINTFLLLMKAIMEDHGSLKKNQSKDYPYCNEKSMK